jgi:hypothetical protein
MRVTGIACTALLIFAGTAAARAAELTSGIEVDGSVPAYTSTKCGGADDGVELGKALCYT